MELKIRFEGIEIYCNDEMTVNERVRVKISYLTAFLFIDGENICSFYPQNLDEEMVESIVGSYCMDHGIDLTREELRAIAQYTIRKVPK